MGKESAIRPSAVLMYRLRLIDRQGTNMIFLNGLKQLTIVLFVTVILFSCSVKPENDAAHLTKPSIRVKAAKPGAPIKLISESIITINPNELSQINIELQTMELGGYLEIDFLPVSGLNLVNTEAHLSLEIVSQTVKLPVTLLAPMKGRYYLNMHTRIKDGESSSTRALAIIVQVGEQKDKDVQFKKISGENVISLPAQEKISAP